MLKTLLGISGNLLTANTLSYPKYFKLLAIDVALNVSLPTPIAVILIPKDLYDLSIIFTALASAGSPSDNVKKISGFLDVNTGSILS